MILHEKVYDVFIVDHNTVPRVDEDLRALIVLLLGIRRHQAFPRCNKPVVKKDESGCLLD
jgi:hypothetical protein